MKMYESPRPIGDYLDKELDCPCGRRHYVPIKQVEIGPGALNKLPEAVRRLGYKRPWLLCDPITWKVAGERCQSLLREAGIEATAHILENLGFDESTLGEIVINLPADCDLMIGVGTGSITDMTRYSSFKLRLPCFTVATGAPMDGFAASIGILNVKGLKATLPAHSTQVIIGDTDILKGAPPRMTVAGFGDLIGKISCLNDWELARIINAEHYCAPIVALVRSCLDKVLSQTEKLENREPEALGLVMEGLVCSGAAISLYGNSRPASGAEHHLSHYWETIGEQRGTPFAMHGEQVAVGTGLVLSLAEALLEEEVDFGAAREAARRYDPAAWAREMERAYGPAAPEVLRMEAEADKNGTEGRLRRIDSMEKNWAAVRAQLKTLPSATWLRELLRRLGCPALPGDIGIDRTLLKDSLMVCKEIRPRYTIFQTVWDLGLLDKLSDRVIEKMD